MKTDKLIVKIKQFPDENLELFLIQYYKDNFQDVIHDIVRYYSIYINFRNNNVDNQVKTDYYQLLFIKLRHFFEPKMKTKVDILNSDLSINDYQIRFITWINKFIEVFKSIKFDAYFNRVNKTNINKLLEKLFKSLHKFEEIHNDKYLDELTPVTLKDRIYRHASKFVAHNMSKHRIVEWENINSVFVERDELEKVVSTFSEIQNNYKRFYYYYSNTTKMKEKNFDIDLELKINEYFKEFIKDTSI